MGDGSDIVVKGGSVQVVFDSDLYQQDISDRKLHKHEGRKMTRVRVFESEEAEEPLYDSGTKEEGMLYLVRITTAPA